MRTTVEISDSLFARVRTTMERRRTTLRALVEEGLSRVVDEGGAPPRVPPRRAVFARELGLVAPLTPQDLPELLRALRSEGRETQ